MRMERARGNLKNPRIVPPSLKQELEMVKSHMARVASNGLEEPQKDSEVHVEKEEAIPEFPYTPDAHSSGKQG